MAIEPEDAGYQGKDFTRKDVSVRKNVTAIQEGEYAKSQDAVTTAQNVSACK